MGSWFKRYCNKRLCFSRKSGNQISYPEKFSPMVMQGDYWRSLYKHSWETMAILLLPTGVILSTSLITQMEYKNNTWKQVFASPQSLSTIFLSKLTITLLMMLAFFILFTLGILISAYLPPLLNGTNVFPSPEIPNPPLNVLSIMNPRLPRVVHWPVDTS